VSHVKFRTARNPGVPNVERNANIEIVSTRIWPPIANAAAVLRRDFFKLKTMSAPAKGTAGNTQRLLTMSEFIP
jgi:hypothetical protein